MILWHQCCNCVNAQINLYQVWYVDHSTCDCKQHGYLIFGFYAATFLYIDYIGYGWIWLLFSMLLCTMACHRGFILWRLVSLAVQWHCFCCCCCCCWHLGGVTHTLPTSSIKRIFWAGQRQHVNAQAFLRIVGSLLGIILAIKSTCATWYDSHPLLHIDFRWF